MIIWLFYDSLLVRPSSSCDLFYFGPHLAVSGIANHIHSLLLFALWFRYRDLDVLLCAGWSESLEAKRCAMNDRMYYVFVVLVLPALSTGFRSGP